MKWKRVPKEQASQPADGIYSDWKEILAKEGFFQCVYCAIHESCFGGTRNFHVEHYRPKKKFRSLENDIKNLFYACPICNTFKGDDWPNEPRDDLSIPSYPDPSKVEYSSIFNNFDSGIIEGNFLASKYMVEKMYLNRPQLVVERRIYLAYLKLEMYEKVFNEIIPILEERGGKEAHQFLAEIAKQFIGISRLQRKVREIRPYQPEDVKKK